MHRYLAAIAIASLASVLAACGGGATGGGASFSGTAKIGAPLSLTGPGAFAGSQIQEGEQLAIDEVNSTKFLGGATLAASYVDVAATPQQGVTVLRQMIEQDQVNAVVGWTLSGQTPAAAPIAQAAKVPMIVAEGGAPGVSSTGDYITQTNIQQFKFADKMGAALKKRGVATTQLLYAQDNPTVTTLVHTYTDQVFPKYGIKATLKAYVGTDTDLSAGITQAMAVGVDAIGCLFVGAQGVTCLSQARTNGYKGQLWGQAGFASGVALNAGPVAEGLLFTTSFSADLPYDATKKFVQLYSSKHPGKVPTQSQAEGYDGIWLLARAIKEGNGTSRDAIHAGLLKVEAKGMDNAVQGPMTWDRDRMALGPGAVIQIVNGKETLFL